MSIEKKILFTASLEFNSELKEKIISNTKVVYAYGSSSQELLNLNSVYRFSGWVCSPTPNYYIGSELLDRFTDLEILSSPSTGSSHVDRDYLISRDISFFCLKGSSIVNEIYASSEYTFGILISLLKNIPSSYTQAKKGVWREKEEDFRGRELHSLSIGIIGYGRIGSNLSKYCNAFNMQVYAYDPYVHEFDDWVLKVSDIQTITKNVDILAPCVHLNSETEGLIGQKEIFNLRRGSYLINTSRGEVIDEDALISAIESKHLAGAAVDVISGEQTKNIKTHKLVELARKNKNFYITPHIAGLTIESESKAQTAAYEAVTKYLESI